jgi:hypothetical protein
MNKKLKEINIETIKENSKKFFLDNMVISMLLLGGCSKDAKCDIKDKHAHFYVSDISFDKFVLGEKEQLWNHIRTEEYILIDDEAEKLISFENIAGLYRIAYNQEKTNNIVSEFSCDYVEYEYQDMWLQLVPMGIMIICMCGILPMIGQLILKKEI